MLEPGALRSFANSDTWHVFEYGENEFDKFARAKVPGGLQVSDGVDGLIRICHATKGEDSDVALRLMRELTPAGAQHGGKREQKGQGDTITLPRGNSETYLLRRLKRDRPELAARVFAGEISAHRATLEAGIRRPIVQVVATVGGFVRAAQKHLTAKQRADLVWRLQILETS